MSTQPSFTKAMQELEEINRWFQSSDIDLEAGLEKLRRGKELIQFCQKRLDVVENEFQTIKADLETSPQTAAAATPLTAEIPDDLPF